MIGQFCNYIVFSLLSDDDQFVTSGGSNSYLSIFYQFVNSVRFTGDENQDVDNYLTVRRGVKRVKNSPGVLCSLKIHFTFRRRHLAAENGTQTVTSP